MPDRLGSQAAGPVLILTPTGRDAEGAQHLLAKDGIDSRICQTIGQLAPQLDEAAGLVLVADEALFGIDLTTITRRLHEQPPWSDIPFIILTQSGIAARRQMAELNLPKILGNVLFLERPLNAMSLISAVKTAMRARQRQRQVRDYLAERVGAAERTQTMLEERVAERTAALETAEQERRQIAAALAQSQKMEAVGQLTGGLAHDFNNLLTGISGSLELMNTRIIQGRHDDLGRYIGAAQGAAKRAASLTHRLLAFSRQQTLDPKPTDVNRLVAGMEELIRRTVGPTIEISVIGDPDLWVTRVDSHQLENALLNLCINARDAMPEGGRLWIETSNQSLDDHAAGKYELPPGEYLALRVRDTGTGMPPEVIKRAFDPFFTTKPLGQGTGLGLSMIYGFARQSGGQVRIESELGRGTTLSLYLPRHDGAIEAAAAPDQAAQRTHAGHGRTVLLVDDEGTVRMLVSDVLSDLGYKLLEASDSAGGLAVLQSRAHIDLLVTDVGLPGGMNGRQMAEAGREHRPGLKVLFITGYAETTVLGDGGLEDGMQVLTKPFTVEALSSRIQDLIDSGCGG